MLQLVTSASVLTAGPREARQRSAGPGQRGCPDQRHQHHRHRRRAGDRGPRRQRLRHELRQHRAERTLRNAPRRRDPAPCPDPGDRQADQQLRSSTATPRSEVSCAGQPGGGAPGTAIPGGGQRRRGEQRPGPGHAARAAASPSSPRPAQDAAPGPGRRARPGPGRGVPARQPGRRDLLQGGRREPGGRPGAGGGADGDLMAQAGPAAGGDAGSALGAGHRSLPLATHLAPVRPPGA